jgi:SWIM zinc finger
MVASTESKVKTLNVCGKVAPVDAWHRAYERAKSEGVKVYRDGDEWTTTSTSEPGRRHRVNGSCDCQGAEKGLICKHLSAVVAAQLRAGVLARCPLCGYIGRVGDEIVVACEWLGGHGWADFRHCKDETACWARWDLQHLGVSR